VAVEFKENIISEVLTESYKEKSYHKLILVALKVGKIEKNSPISGPVFRFHL